MACPTLPQFRTSTWNETSKIQWELMRAVKSPHSERALLMPTHITTILPSTGVTTGEPLSTSLSHSPLYLPGV